MMLRPLLAAAALCLAVPALAQTVPPIPLRGQVEAALAKAPAGTRFGLLVVDENGREILAINPDSRFIPASNTKLFTTAAAYALLPGVDQNDVDGANQVGLLPGKNKKVPNVLLVGRGDARMSAAADCTVDCLAALADAVAARTRQVGDVLGDDTRFPDLRWSPGMSWNNFGSNDATAASALSLDSNEMTVRVLPGAPGAPPVLSVPGYVTITNEAVTGAPGSRNSLVLEHTVNSRAYRLYGEIAADAKEWRERIGVDDPAHFAAWTLAEMLKARGVSVKGQVRAIHRPARLIDIPPPPGISGGVPDARSALIGPPRASAWTMLASLTPPPLAEDIAIINKVSQNNHAETLLRRIGLLNSLGSPAYGLEAARTLFEKAGIPRAGFDFSDGSGMSTYNRVSPRAGVALLRWAKRQSWGAAWRAGFPVGGVDGTLKRRFAGTALEGKLQAKTGSLNATNALSGYLIAASGRELTFSTFANDVPDGGNALPAMDAALVAIAAAN